MTLEQLLERALLLACESHKGQVDKANFPYIFHPIAVAEKCETIEQKIVALLHDTLEDTELTAEDLRKEGFPEHIILAIQTLTRNEGEDYETFIKRCSLNSLAKTVKICDLLHNMSPTRLNNLPAYKRKYLHKKYSKALIDLGYTH